tara:strand:- start:866 stop:1609 length:744 start_codon:yes stop_codon:yes gene_type:complete
MLIFKSESATKTQQNNAKILFGSKGIAVLAKLETYSKEKVLNTAGIDAVLDMLKTKDTALLEKFADSKTGKTLAKNCKQLAAAKTFTAIMKNVKQIKVLKSFDKFGTVSSEPSTRRSHSVKGFADILSNLYGKDWEERTALFNTMLGTSVNEAGIANDSIDEGLYIIMQDGNAAYYVKKTASKRFFQKLGVAKPVDLIYVDTLDGEGPYSGDPDIVPGTLMTAKTAAQRSKLFKTFLGWAKNGVTSR